MNLEALRVFVKVAELGSFTQAGAQLGLRKAKVSLQVKALEASLGSQLLQRSTRVVRLTPEGEELLPRARRLLTEAEELESLFQVGKGVRGRVRVDLPVNFARTLIIPRLPELLARHPELELVLSTTDRRVDAMREGFDCVLRIGAQRDSQLVGRKLGWLKMINCASPGYLLKFGTPQRLEDLDRHLLIHYSAGLGAETPGFEYPVKGGYADRPMRSVLTVNTADASAAACLAGLGIVQSPRVGYLGFIAAGTCVEVLPALTCAPMPVSLVHTHGKSVPRRVRAVMNWIAELLTPHLAAGA